MANYYGTVRTNYFHVKDEEQFRALMAKTAGDEDGLVQQFGRIALTAVCRQGIYGKDGDIPERFHQADQNGDWDNDAILVGNCRSQTDIFTVQIILILFQFLVNIGKH